MATAKELGLKPGDIALTLEATIDVEGELCLCLDLDDPEAKIGLAIYKVERLGPFMDGLVDGVEARRLNRSEVDPHTGPFIFLPGYDGFISEGDEKLRGIMKKAGIRLQAIIERDGTASYELVKVEEEDNDS